MKHRRLDQPQRRHGRRRGMRPGAARKQRGQMPLDAQFRGFERKRRILAILRQHVKAELRVEDFLRHVLERQQADGLLLQLLHSGRAALAGRFENLDHGPPHRKAGMQARQHHGDGDGCRMRDRVYGIFRRAESGWLHEGRANERTGVVFGRVRQVDGSRRFRAQFERPQCGFRRSRQQYYGRIAQGRILQSPDQRRFAALLGQRAGLLGIFGNQLQIHRHVTHRDQVAQFAPQQRFTADQRPRI